MSPSHSKAVNYLKCALMILFVCFKSNDICADFKSGSQIKAGVDSFETRWWFNRLPPTVSMQMQPFSGDFWFMIILMS